MPRQICRCLRRSRQGPAPGAAAPPDPAHPGPAGSAKLYIH